MTLKDIYIHPSARPVLSTNDKALQKVTDTINEAPKDIIAIDVELREMSTTPGKIIHVMGYYQDSPIGSPLQSKILLGFEV
jgi:hypothetical protein